MEGTGERELRGSLLIYGFLSRSLITLALGTHRLFLSTERMGSEPPATQGRMAVWAIFPHLGFHRSLIRLRVLYEIVVCELHGR